MTNPLDGQNANRQAYPYPAGDNRGVYNNQNNFGGPSPECFTAIQSGDFAKAKETCSAPTNSYQYQSPKICPATAIAQCPEGQYREQRFTDNCPVYGHCL